MYLDNKQPESKHAFYHLEICCRYVGDKYGRPDIADWTNGDYIKLSGKLSRHTDVQISPNTLKRIFGKLKTSERYYPQKATRDTLARYAGFKDWEMFVEQHPRPKINGLVTETIPETVLTYEKLVGTEPIKKKNWRPLSAAIATAAILVCVVIFNESSKTGLTGLEGVRLICNNPEGTNPHSAVFRLLIPPAFQGNANNFTLNFDDSRKPKAIGASKTVTHYYEIPGRYYAVLSYNARPLDTVTVYIKTEGWTATVNLQNDTTRVYPLPYQSLFKNHQMRVDALELFHAGVDTNRTFFVHFVNTTPMEISGDNFECVANLISSGERPGVRCSQVNIAIFGERSKHFLSIMKPGCSVFNEIKFSDHRLTGESADLSALGKDLSKGGRVTLEVKDRQGLLWINGKQVYQAGYKTSVGKIYGIGISFSGIGEVHSVALRDLKTGKTFQSIF